MAEDPLQNETLISLVEAAEYSGLTHDFLRQLASKGKLRARKFGRNWLTTREAVDEYLQGRSPVGRKPKSQKDTWQNSDNVVLFGHNKRRAAFGYSEYPQGG